MRFAVFLGAALAATDTARADDYLMVFSADSTPYRPTKGHTFAAVAKVEHCADGKLRVVDLKSLSWLPVTMKVRAWALCSEKGRNVPLHETIRTYSENGGKVQMWGPYRVHPE